MNLWTKCYTVKRNDPTRTRHYRVVIYSQPLWRWLAHQGFHQLCCKHIPRRWTRMSDWAHVTCFHLDWDSRSLVREFPLPDGDCVGVGLSKRQARHRERQTWQQEAAEELAHDWADDEDMNLTDTLARLDQLDPTTTNHKN